MKIKYKLWHSVDKQWTSFGSISPSGVISSHQSYKEVVPCAFTGLTDKEGNEVYNQDVLALPEGEWMRGEGGMDDRAEVYYDESLARFGLNFFSIHGGEGYTGKEEHISDYIKRGWVVIGNSNPNPELLYLQD
jgi:hypothetical protein